MTLAPVHIEILLHYGVSTGQHPRFSAVMQFIDDLVRLGALEPQSKGSGYVITDMGIAWVKLMCRTEPPRQCWVDAAGKLVE